MFPISHISDHIVIGKEKEEKHIYIYQIFPVTLLEMSVPTQQNIISIYTQILREFTIPIQILVSNKRLEVENYLSTYFSSTTVFSSKILNLIYREYVNDMRKKLQEENIYESKYYISITVCPQQDMLEIERILYKLEKIGCRLEKIKNAMQLKKLLYEMIHKISLEKEVME